MSESKILKGSKNYLHNSAGGNARTKKTSLLSIRAMVAIALLSALATVLMLFEVPLWFVPSFYELDFSEVPVLIGAFALGPVAGILIELIKILLNLLFNGTDTAFIGELANFLLGCSLVVPSAAVYARYKNRKSAIAGMVIGTICFVIVGSFLNAFVLLPVYSKMFIPLDLIIAEGTKVNKYITNMSSFIFLGVVPFNLIKGIAVSLITTLLYKYVSPVIKGYNN